MPIPKKKNKTNQIIFIYFLYDLTFDLAEKKVLSKTSFAKMNSALSFLPSVFDLQPLQQKATFSSPIETVLVLSIPLLLKFFYQKNIF